jgi:hypothetical protein
MIRSKGSVVAALALLLVAPRAFAEDSRFGRDGTLVLSSDTGASAAYTTSGGASVTSWTLDPSADYFVRAGVSVGGFASISSAQTSTMKDASLLALVVGARVGYNIRLGDAVSLWPKVGVSFTTLSQQGASSSITALNLFAPVIVEPRRHFFLGFGPKLDRDLTGPSTTTLGLGFTIGGWFGG